MKIEKVYWTISEVAEMINVDTFTLRFWEREFYWLSPKRSKKGTRKFSKKDIEDVKSINLLLNDLGITHSGIIKAYSKDYNKDLEQIINKVNE